MPAYFQMAADIERRVERGEWGVGEKLPGEGALAQEYGVTRMTARQAYAQLAKSGIVELPRGRGAHVIDRRRPVIWDLDLTSHAVDLVVRSQGLEPSGTVLSGRVLDVPTHALRSQLQTDGPVFQAERRIYMDKVPISLHQSNFALDRLPGIDEAPDLAGPLATVLRRHGASPVRAENEIEVTRATPSDAKLLATRYDTPIVSVEGTSFDADDVPIEHYWMRFVGDRVRFHTNAHSL